MSLNGKRDDFTIDDFKACARNASMKRGRAEEIIHDVQAAISQWKHFARKAGVPPDVADGIAKAHRTDIPRENA
jgi:serine/threonine-protein kinase HipA